MSFNQIIIIGGGLSGASAANTEFNMFHKKDAIMKYAPEIILGNIIQPKL